MTAVNVMICPAETVVMGGGSVALVKLAVENSWQPPGDAGAAVGRHAFSPVVNSVMVELCVAVTVPLKTNAFVLGPLVGALTDNVPPKAAWSLR